MSMNARLLVLVIFAFAAAPVPAAEVYRWVDDEGIVHYSQWAPESQQQELARIDVPTSTPDDYDPAGDPYSVLNQAARIHETYSALTARDADRQSTAETSRSRDEDPDDEARYRDEPYLYAPPPRRPARRDPLAVQRRQLDVVDELERRGTERAYSINSSVHRARVAASEEAVEAVRRGPGHARKR